MPQHRFAIVCDSTCDLPPEIISRLEVVCVPLSVEAGGKTYRDDADHEAGVAALRRSHASARILRPGAEEFLAMYRALIAEGYANIATVCSSLPRTGTWAAAEEAIAQIGAQDGLRMRTVDTGVASVGSGIVVERLAMARKSGVEFEQAVNLARALAHEVRTLFIPEASSGFMRDAIPRKRSRLMARATTLRLRLAGERTLFLLSHGEWTALARSTDMGDLCGRSAHAMSSVASSEGDLVYAVLGAAGSKGLRALEKPLDTNEFCSLRLGRGNASLAILATLGTDAVGVSFVPKEIYLRAGACDPLPKGLIPGRHDGPGDTGN